MNYKLKYFDKTKTIRNGIYLNIEDLVAAMFNEKIEYKEYCSQILNPENFEVYLSAQEQYIKSLINLANNNIVDLKYCRIDLLED